MIRWRRLLIVLLGVLLIAGAAWVARGRLAVIAAQTYFRQHGIASQVTVGRLGFSGFSGGITLGPPGAPVFSARALEVKFNPARWSPQIVEVRLVDPQVRAAMDAQGRITVPGLQDWINSLSTGGAKSDLVSDDLAVSLTGLRAFVTTPAGPLALTGDVRLVRGDLESLALAIKPGTYSWHGATLDVASATAKIAKGGQAQIHLDGAIRKGTLAADRLSIAASAEKITWTLSPQLSAAASSLHLSLAAASLRQGDMEARDVNMVLDGTALKGAMWNGKAQGSAALTVKGNAAMAAPALVKSLAAFDAKLAGAIKTNLARLALSGAMHVTAQDGALRIAQDAPLLLKGAGGAVLKVTAPEYKDSSFGGTLTASLSGGGMPGLDLTAHNLALTSTGFSADTALNARFGLYMLHGATLAARGRAALADGAFSFAARDCATASLDHFAAGDLARRINGKLCAATVSADTKGWRVAADARDVAMLFPIATSRLESGAGRIAFSGRGSDFGGTIKVTGGKVADTMPSPRFNPLAGTGDIKLASGQWTGTIAMSDGAHHALGNVTFHHDMQKAMGEARVSAPKITFTADGLQPETLSPLLAVLSHAEGTAKFEGVLGWSASGSTSHGTLDIDGLDFLTPMGKAHTTRTSIKLRSLLPPITEPGQHLAISRIDWTIPFSGLAMDFSASPLSVRIDTLKSSFAEGQVSLGALAIDLTGTGHTQGAATLNSIALAPLIAASNLSSKVKLEGKVTGNIPFTLGPEGLRIVNGRLTADGPGRLSIDRSLWGEAVSINAVQDLAYQALETLAFDQLTAEINSVAAGRLQILFHIKGQSAPAHPQQAQIAVADVLDGSALQKPIALPNGTPIDLTLDTSLNFDELLKSYAEAWSKTLSPD